MTTCPYEDILYLTHPASKVYPPMPRSRRAAQFGAFVALTGHKEAVMETARVTEKAIVLSEDMRDILDWRLQWLEAHLAVRPLVQLSYFVADAKKAGGHYEDIAGRIQRIDRRKQRIVFETGVVVPMMDVVAIEGVCFEENFG